MTFVYFNGNGSSGRKELRKSHNLEQFIDIEVSMSMGKQLNKVVCIHHDILDEIDDLKESGGSWFLSDPLSIRISAFSRSIGRSDP